MIDATWELQEPTGEVFRYRVSWIPNGSSFSAAWCYVNSSATSTSACDVYPTLDSCTLYNVTVQPRTFGRSAQINTGTPASAATYTLLDVPPAGSPPEVSSVASRSVTLTWIKPATKCEVVNYTVVYGGQIMWGNHATLEVNSAYSETTTINIAGLTPYSNYSFSVVAATAAGKGEPSLPTYCVTLEDEPNIGLIVGMLCAEKIEAELICWIRIINIRR
ncbi:immunoglobulin superfamily member 22-like [Hyalella azteca]|uniref:Immunoglobulin superfamily member 22-like n=1 Tax=Hyalella azteca TaxID=294128 RepID=A0A979FFD6_HYAAZ|nr:immunoglobulin superfamily member 22-like [Hyalella azteca]